MNQKTAKLIKKVAKKIIGNYKAMKRNYKKLFWRERYGARKKLKEIVNGDRV